ncbi:hypothetical protein [Synechococcus sp. CCY 9618]|uniref:hypothetical protein n=1 Tax=Synechococcus sp. CCY 9618 TaxID=2815602 RepID=UPI001C219918|nr:hypothetical protein [Synechococcus sp. CCY 9618]
MNLTKLLARAAGTALLPAAFLFGSANSAHAFGVEFTPVGADLDADIISDLEIPFGQATQDFFFQINLNQFGLPFFGFAGSSLTALSYELGFDSTEWNPNAASIAACNADPSCETDPGVPPGALTSGSGIDQFYTISLSNTPGLLITGGLQAPFFFPGPITGDVGAALPNNGDADLLATLVSFTLTTPGANGGPAVSTTFFNGQTGDSLLQTVIFGTQSISLQRPAQVPGPLPILGAGAAFGYSRRLRKRVKGANASFLKA